MTENGWSVGTDAVSDLESLERVWLGLQAKSNCSYFQTWGWMGTWLSCIPPGRRPAVLWVARNSDIVGLCALGVSRLKRRLVSSRSLLVNETGAVCYDRVTMEHNGVLAEYGGDSQVVSMALDYLIDTSRDWEEICLSGMDHSVLATYRDAALARGLRPCVVDVAPFYTVDLDMIRASQKPYLSHLSANTRYQIRRCKRAYSERGAIHVQAAGNAVEARTFLEGLRSLHQPYWEQRSAVGAFGTDFTWRFHRRLVEKRFPHGEIQLLRVTAGDSLVGYLYNLLHNGIVYNYQTGFVYPEGSGKMKPGLLSHAEAIEYNVAAGFSTYDLLTGRHRYKASLSTHSEPMIWLRLQRPKLKFRLEEVICSLRDRALGLRS